MSLLKVSHLRKSFNGTVAVEDLSLRVERGEIFGLLGPNGAGKTTALLMLAGLYRPDTGTIAMDGHPAGDRAVRTILGFVPQELAIYPDLKARENLDFFARLYGIRGPRLSQRIDYVLDLIGLKPHANDYVRAFSGGMKRRLNFGVAILHEPRVLILDEPTVGVDPQSRSHILDRVRQLATEGVAVIYASHYMEEVETLCNRIAIMDHGRLLASGTLEELLGASQSNVTLRVKGNLERLRDQLKGHGDIESVDGTEAQITVRRSRNDDSVSTNGRLEKVLHVLQELHADLLSIETTEHNLERLFLDLTGRKLRD